MFDLGVLPLVGFGHRSFLPRFGDPAEVAEDWLVVGVVAGGAGLLSQGDAASCQRVADLAGVGD